MPRPVRRQCSTALVLSLLVAGPSAALAQESARDMPSMSPDSMAVANPEKEQVRTEDGRVVEPGMRVGIDPQLTQALGRLDTAQQDMARLEEVLRGEAPADPTTQPVKTERGEYAQQVIEQAMLALESIEHTNAVPDDLDVLRTTREALVNARRALAEDSLQSTPQVAKARDAMDTLESRLIESADADKGADPATD